MSASDTFEIFDEPWLRPGSRVELRADRQRRTIEGRILPWGELSGVVGGRRWRFRRGSVTWPDDVARVKLLVGHEQSKLVGRARWIEDRGDGLYASFLVGRTPQGDELMSMAADRVVDGFSVGADILETGPGGVVTAAKLVEVSAVGFPALDNARVERVAASRDASSAVPAGERALIDPLPFGGDDDDWNPRLPLGCETVDKWNVKVPAGPSAPIVERHVWRNGVELTVVEDRDRIVREAALAAHINSVICGGRPEPDPWWPPAEQGVFRAEVARLQLAPGKRAADDSLRRLQREATT
jgi:HK97 family phage prohead protease